MIPVSQDEKLVYEDKESGVRYFFKVLTGANEQEYFDIVEKSGKGLDQGAQRKLLDDAIDFILIGWEGENIPEFPKDKKPSKFFKIVDKDKLFGEALKLNSISGDEAKN